MAEAAGMAARRLVRCALGLGAALALAACAPLPADTGAQADAAACRAPGTADAAAAPCPPGALRTAPPRAPAPPRRTAPAPAPVPAAPAAPPAAAAAEPAPEPLRESDQQGLASWYGPGLHGRRTASGERFDRSEFTAAHRTLPFGSRVCVRSSVTGRAVVVRINDRGPFSEGRVIDLSQAAAQELGMTGLGIKPVELWLLGKDEDTCPDAVLDNPQLSSEADAAEAAAAAAEALGARPAARRSAARKPVRTRTAARR